MKIAQASAQAKPERCEPDRQDYLRSIVDHLGRLVVEEEAQQGATPIAKYLGAARYHAIRELHGVTQ